MWRGVNLSLEFTHFTKRHTEFIFTILLFSKKRMISESGAALITAEREGAELAISSKLYTLYKCTANRSCPDFCFRVGPNSRCYCGKTYQACRCPHFEWIPSRPEEVGDDFLANRRGFNVSTWLAKCKCGHPHTEHHGPTRSRRCKTCHCSKFESNFLCMMCDQHWEDHETVIETEDERRLQNKSFGNAFLPLSEAPGLQGYVFGTGKHKKMQKQTPEQQFEEGVITSAEYHELIAKCEDKNGDDVDIDDGGNIVGISVNPAIVRKTKKTNYVDRSVLLSHVSSGGRKTGQIINRYGKAG